MSSSSKKLLKLQEELSELERQRWGLCCRIGAIYNEGRDGDSFDRAFELFQEEFQPLLERIEDVQRGIRRLTPASPKRKVNGRSYPRARRVI